MKPDPALRHFLTPVQKWFSSHLGSPTDAQRLAWPTIRNGESALLLAPTGSGKTLSAFLACLDRLWRDPQNRNGVKVLYISPLKALNNDIERNLRQPLQGVVQTAEAVGHQLRELRAGVRTGDTPTRQRQEQIRRPPDILITTPESLHLLLTSRGREILATVETCLLYTSPSPRDRG